MPKLVAGWVLGIHFLRVQVSLLVIKIFLILINSIKFLIIRLSFTNVELIRILMEYLLNIII